MKRNTSSVGSMILRIVLPRVVFPQPDFNHSQHLIFLYLKRHIIHRFYKANLFLAIPLQSDNISSAQLSQQYFRHLFSIPLSGTASTLIMKTSDQMIRPTSTSGGYCPHMPLFFRHREQNPHSSGGSSGTGTFLYCVKSFTGLVSQHRH